jgi:hypothetical protein
MVSSTSKLIFFFTFLLKTFLTFRLSSFFIDPGGRVSNRYLNIENGKFHKVTYRLFVFY